MNNRSYHLTFHGIGAPARPFWTKEEGFWVDESFFEAILDLIQGRKDTTLSFDDCNSSDIETVLPTLIRRRLKAQFFIVTDLIGKKGFLSKTDIRTLHAAGMVIGNHGKFHRPWRGLSPSELKEELIEARDYLEDAISDTVKLAACPNGSYDRHVLRNLREYGYERVYTSDGGWTSADGWLQVRNSMKRNYNLEDVKKILTSSPFCWNGLTRIAKRTVKRLR